MRRRNKAIKGNDLLSEDVKYNGNYDIETIATYITYNDKIINKADIKNNKIPELNIQGNITWLMVKGLKNTELISNISKKISLPSIALIDIFHTQTITKIEDYDNLLFTTLKLLSFHKNGNVESEQITLILGKGFVITIQESDKDIFSDIQNAIQNNLVHTRTRTADYLFLLLFNGILGKYVEITNNLEESFEEMEEDLLDTYNNVTDFRSTFRVLRMKYQTLKHTISPLKENFVKIRDNDDNLFDPKNDIYINSVYEKFSYLSQSIEICRESFDSLLNIYISNNDLRMNEIMKRLTVISAIFIPLTFLVGVWGMNYEFMPELKFRFGYYIAWIIIILVAFFSWWFMKKKKWY